MDRFCEVFGRQNSEALTNAYYKALKDELNMNVHVLDAVCHKALKECEWFPKPATLIGYTYRPR